MNIHELRVLRTVQIRGSRRQNKRVFPGATINRISANKPVDRISAQTTRQEICSCATGDREALGLPD